ncbi:MAG: M1 family aminopeptidase [Bacillota bacterium]
MPEREQGAKSAFPPRGGAGPRCGGKGDPDIRLLRIATVLLLAILLGLGAVLSSLAPNPPWAAAEPPPDPSTAESVDAGVVILPPNSLELLPLDPPVHAPSGSLPAEARREIELVLAAQSEALLKGDPAGYLSVFRTAREPGDYGAPGSDPETPPLPGVAGSPDLRVRECLFGCLPEGSHVLQVETTPLFLAPGPAGTADVLLRHTVVFQAPGGQPSFVETTALQRLWRDDDGRWWVFDWFVASEKQARPAWLVWVEGKVALEPFADRLQGEMTYTLYPGFLDRSRKVTFDLAESFEVLDIRGDPDPVLWERNGDRIRVSFPAPAGSSGAAAGPAAEGTGVTVTITYQGRVETETLRRGRLESLDAEGIYLRPGTGWYPRPAGGGAVRGTLTVTVPGWWAAAASGRLVGHSPTRDLTSFTWGLDTPAEIYLAAGPYRIGTLSTGRGVVIRTFFYPLNAEHAAAYLTETARILDVFSRLFTPYPYTNLTLAEVCRFYYGGLSARSLILLDAGGLDDPRDPRYARDLLAHEISHQWWGEIIPVWGNIEWYLWEGLATYSEALYTEAVGGRAALARSMQDKADVFSAETRGRRHWSVSEAGVRTENWQDRFVYEKGAWVFHTLRFLLGDEDFFALLRRYINHFAGRQPATADLEALIAEAAGGDPYLLSYVDRWVRGTDSVDLSFSRVSSTRTESGTSLRFELVDRGTGDFPWAEVELGLQDGRTSRLLLRPGEHVVEVPGTVVSLEADPDRWVLDLERANNRYRRLLGVWVPEQTATASARVALVAAAVVALGALVPAARRRSAGGPVAPPGAGDFPPS